MSRKRGKGQFSFDLGWEPTPEPPPEPAPASSGSEVPPGSEAPPTSGTPPTSETPPTSGTPPSPVAGAGSDAPPGPRPDLGDASVLVRVLARIAREHPLERKVIVCRTGGEGREILRQLALRTGSWVGFEATTTRVLAITVVGGPLAARGLGVTDAFDEEALLDEAIDEVLLGGDEDEHARLARGAGMRRALARAVTSLRLAGISAARLRETPLANRAKARVLSGVLGAYEARLRGRRLTDAAGVLRAATRALRTEAAGGRADPLAHQRVYLVPGIRRRGLAGRFLSALRRRGAQVLEADPVRGLDAPPSLVWRAAEDDTNRLSHLHDVEGAPEASSAEAPASAPDARGPSPDARVDPRDSAPSLDIFVANSVEAELREVMRRAVERGPGWDDVEIVAIDPAVYGSALHALAERTGVPVTFATGLPVERTRPGRVAAAWFRWIEGGFHAGVVRTLLYASDLTAPRPHHWIRGATLARRLRHLRIGWGRDRYLPAIERALADVDKLPARKYDTPEKLERRRRRRRRELQALRSLLAPSLRATPPVSMDAGGGGEVRAGREVRAGGNAGTGGSRGTGGSASGGARAGEGRDAGGGNPVAVSPSQVARGLRRFLAGTSPGTSVDDTARARMERILERIEATLTRPADYRAAAATVRRHLSFPVPAPRAEGGAPWSSAGGALYLTDIGNGGRTGRRATFIVGLDAHRMGGPGMQDPYLLDTDRVRLAGADLPLSPDRIRERRFHLAALVARLRGSVCLSYSAWDPAEARAVSPSSELLQAFRLMRGAPSATFEDLQTHVRDRAGLVPRRTPRLDATDVWMAALEREGRLLEGEAMVRSAFPRIDAGMRARDALSGDQVTAFHGRIVPRPELDPRRNPARAVSASGLSTLGACAKRYFYAYVLGARPPDDPEYDPETWLDALRRGSVLHRVYERSLKEARTRAIDYGEPAFEGLVRAILGEEVLRIARDIPTPSDVVRARQEEELAVDAESFVAMIRDTAPSWIETELAFGFRGEEPVPFASTSGPVMVRGAIDRLDRVPGGLRVVDYKTGGTYGFGGKSGIYHGGRRLQHVIYTAVAGLLREGAAAAMEYHFPTRKGENRTVPYSARDLVAGPELVSRLLDLVARGHFLPTDTADDCRFCDYKPVCRVRETRFGVTSPLAEWVRERINDVAELRGLRLIRNWDHEGDGFLHTLEASHQAGGTTKRDPPADGNPGGTPA